MKKNNGKNALLSLKSALLTFVDIEVSGKKTILDIGALRHDGATFHNNSPQEFFNFIDKAEYLCGHNIVNYDSKYLFKTRACRWILVDTLTLSPLLFPNRPYHHLVKDYKLESDEINNPLKDCELDAELLQNELDAWQALPTKKQMLFASLLYNLPEFSGFFHLVGAQIMLRGVSALIHELYEGKICAHADLNTHIKQNPCALAYALALIDTADKYSITPQWVLHNYPEVETIMRSLRHTNCEQNCAYCAAQFDVQQHLKRIFGYDNFRTYEGEPLQENAVRAAVHGDSLLAVFPTGGGKSLTFQLPALIAGETMRGLTVVISPLQSLMKDQVDNLAKIGISEAETINGLLNPIERKTAIQRVQDGEVALLYIAPEMLRSKTIERLLFARHIVRFVIDEAHCFSSWGHDFRVDYLYIATFIQKYQEQKRCNPIAISCFTATAKQKVIQDIGDYFMQHLGVKLQLFTSTAARTNLQYSVIHVQEKKEKYAKLRALIKAHDCPTIIYVARTKHTHKLAAKLCEDGFPALPFNGKMEADEKKKNQDDFMNDRVKIIVATSAFGMGVDKSNVGLVVHYTISESLENYVQEAGRAGRDPKLNARCYVLFCDDDLNAHFMLLNQTKLNFNEICQIWKAIKKLTWKRKTVNCSALEIARKAGWEDETDSKTTKNELETRVRTAIATLEHTDFLIRGTNAPRVFATGITVKNMDEARHKITASLLFNSDEERENAARIIKSLISKKYIATVPEEDAESRVDYLADMLGIDKKEIILAVERMRQAGILADTQDITAYLLDVSEQKSRKLLQDFAKLEDFLFKKMKESSSKNLQTSFKQLNDEAISAGIKEATEKKFKTLLHFLKIKGYLQKSTTSTAKNSARNHNVNVEITEDFDNISKRFEKRKEICNFTIEWLYAIAAETQNSADNAIQFSIIKLLEALKSPAQNLFGGLDEVQLEDVEEALLYLSKIDALKLEGGFLVLYNAMNIQRVKDTKEKFTKSDYAKLQQHYQMKIEQVHIVGEYANLMSKDYTAAQRYVQDYFQLEFDNFVAKYFDKKRAKEIKRNITQKKYNELFGNLTKQQLSIIQNDEANCIVVAAGPGSGKTMVLVRKLASLLLLEDVKHEQLLMLTFSRAAATEFKQRLKELIKDAADFVEIKTFHSFAFDILGRMGNLEDTDNIVQEAVAKIEQNEVVLSKISKKVLVIDEAQDMSENEYKLVRALQQQNEDMRIIAVGDDDQNINTFRGADSKYMCALADKEHKETNIFVEMTENFRSKRHIVEFANNFVTRITPRLKTAPIISMSEDNGWVEVTQHRSEFIYEPLVENLLRQRDLSADPPRSIGVLTQTNEEAATLAALLQKRGVNSKLIQSNDGCKIGKVAEMRYFLKQLEKQVKTPLITDKIWENAKKTTFVKYQKSPSLKFVKNCIEQFEKLDNTRYLNDFKEFVFNSSVSTFSDISANDVVVSTIHKAKGKQFDDVFMLITNNQPKNYDCGRCFYVGITRAKQRLFIHTNKPNFEFPRAGVDQYFEDEHEYALPAEIVLPLSLKNVNLGFFEADDVKTYILQNLECGVTALNFSDNIFYSVTEQPVAMLAKEMKNRLAKWCNGKNKYEVSSAAVRFVVSWKNEGKEWAVLLIDLTLCRCDG